MKTYYFIRHGASESDVGNAPAREIHNEVHTWNDWPLSEKGEAQAVRVGRKLREMGVEIVLSSALSRTRSTAEIAGREAGIPYGGGWEEANEVIMGQIFRSGGSGREQGQAGGAASRLIRPLWPVLYRGLTIAYLFLWQWGKTEGGETREDVEGRILQVLRKLESLPQERIALVGHGYWILFLARFLRRGRGAGLPLVPPGGWVSNGSFTKIRRDGEKTDLEYFAVPFHRAVP